MLSDIINVVLLLGGLGVTFRFIAGKLSKGAGEGMEENHNSLEEEQTADDSERKMIFEESGLTWAEWIAMGTEERELLSNRRRELTLTLEAEREVGVVNGRRANLSADESRQELLSRARTLKLQELEQRKKVIPTGSSLDNPIDTIDFGLEAKLRLLEQRRLENLENIRQDKQNQVEKNERELFKRCSLVGQALENRKSTTSA